MWLRIKKKKDIVIISPLLPPSLWKETMRCVAQPTSIDSGIFVIEPGVPNSILGFIFVFTSTVKQPNFNEVPTIKLRLPPNEERALHDLIFPFLMVASKFVLNDKIRTSKRVTFGWSEMCAKTHSDFQGMPCNENKAYYPRRNETHLKSPFTNHFLNNLIPILNENFLCVQGIFKYHFPHQPDPITVLKEYIDMLPFPYELSIVKDDQGNYLLQQNNLLMQTFAGCTSRMSVAFAAGKKAREMIIRKMFMRKM